MSSQIKVKRRKILKCHKKGWIAPNGEHQMKCLIVEDEVQGDAKRMFEYNQISDNGNHYNPQLISDEDSTSTFQHILQGGCSSRQIMVNDFL